MIADTPAPLLRHWARQLRALAPTVCDSRLRTELSSLAETYETAADRGSPDDIEPLVATQKPGSNCPVAARDTYWPCSASGVIQNTALHTGKL